MIHLEDGIAKFQAGDLYGALSDLTQFIKNNPASAQAYIVAGATCFALQDYDGAIECHSQAISLDPTLAEAYGERGLAYYELGDKRRAIFELDYSIQLNPTLGNSYYCRGNIYYELGYYTATFEDFKRAAKLFQNQPLTSSIEHNLHRIQEYFRNSLESMACGIHEFISQGLEQRQAGQMEAALRLVNLAIHETRGGSADAYFVRGTLYMEIGRTQAAMQDFTQAVGLNPALADAYYNRGCIYFDASDWQKAIEEFEQCLKLDPLMAYGYYNLGNAQLGLGNKALAVTYLEKAALLFDEQGAAENARNTVFQLIRVRSSMA